MGFGNSFLFRKVTILGVGLIGGSLGRALKKHKLAGEIFGVSRRKEALIAAVKSCAIDHGTQDIHKAVANADLVVLATPVNTVAVMFELIAPHIKRGCIVMDVGSTKATIVAAAQQKLPNPSMFVGAHPLTGSEKRGVENAVDDLFAGSLCVMTPVEGTHRSAVDRVKRMWEALGAQVKMMSPEDHDTAVTYVSHLPHIAAFALIGAIPESNLPMAAQGLKDTTRIASSSPEIWSDICLANAKNIVKAIDEFVGVLSVFRKAISEEDEKSLLNELKKSKLKRDKVL
jgi:prephenate dehydrogenase